MGVPIECTPGDIWNKIMNLNTKILWTIVGFGALTGTSYFAVDVTTQIQLNYARKDLLIAEETAKRIELEIQQLRSSPTTTPRSPFRLSDLFGSSSKNGWLPSTSGTAI